MSPSKIIEQERLGTPFDVENEVFERATNGDLKAFGNPYDFYSKYLYSTSLDVLMETTLAEEVVHDIFIYLFENGKRFRGDSKLAFSWALISTRSRSLRKMQCLERQWTQKGESAGLEKRSANGSDAVLSTYLLLRRSIPMEDTRDYL